MSKSYIYESPKGERKRSAPIDENDAQSREVLESRGWKIVQTLDNDALPDESLIDAEPDFNSLGTPSMTEPGSLALMLTTEQLDALAEAGYHTPASIRDASDADLRAVPGIGPATVRNLRAALAK